MNKIDLVFQQLRSQGRKAYIPFLTAGDPDLEMTARLVRELSARGASLIELGLRRAQQFNWRSSARKTIEVYREILGLPG